VRLGLGGLRGLGRLRGLLGFFTLLGAMVRWCFRIRLSLELVKHFLVQPERLLPHFQFVPRLLRLLFIRSKIKTKVYVRHVFSLRCYGTQVKARQFNRAIIARHSRYFCGFLAGQRRIAAGRKSPCRRRAAKLLQASGYGILTSDKKFIKFDAAGDGKITEALKASDKKDHLRVDVSGEVKGDTLEVTLRQAPLVTSGGPCGRRTGS